MSTTVRVQGRQPQFPQTCVVCQQLASQTFAVEHSFYFGKNLMSFSLLVPMCDFHHTQATRKNKAEQRVGKFGLFFGVILGVIIGAGLLFYWSATAQGSLFMNLFLAAFMAVSFFLIIWLTTLYWLAPLFADSQSKKVRQSVQITDFRPASDVMSIQFANDQTADDFIKVNGNIIIQKP